MFNKKILKHVGLMMGLPLLACAVLQQRPQPTPELPQLAFEIQTATPTSPPLLLLADAPTATLDPNATPTSAITGTLTVTNTKTVTPTLQAQATEEAAPVAAPTQVPSPTPTVPLAEPISGGEWDFEAGFEPWFNPFGDGCAGAGLATGWSAFTTRDQFGSSCFNQTTWKDNVFTGGNAQEITFAYVGNQAGIFKSVPTTPGHRYTIEAYFRREFSPSKVEVSLGVDTTGNQNWEAESVQWFPWNEDFDDQWSKTEQIVTATSESMTIFIKGFHPYPEPGGALRLDSIRIVDIGPE